MLHVEDGMEVKVLEVWAELLAVRRGSYQLVEVNGDRATMK